MHKAKLPDIQFAQLLYIVLLYMHVSEEKFSKRMHFMRNVYKNKCKFTNYEVTEYACVDKVTMNVGTQGDRLFLCIHYPYS